MTTHSILDLPPAPATALPGPVAVFSIALALNIGTAVAAVHAQAPQSLRTVIAAPVSSAGTVTADGVVEAVRQTAMSAPVQGTLVSLLVQAGDRVTAGQVLARVDARAAQQASRAGEAQVQAARAATEVARRTLGRQRDLQSKGFISQAALDQAEAEFKAAEAGLNAQIAQAGVARTQEDFHVIRAPYAGVVSEVPVVVGDLAQPGRPLVVLVDPAVLRVTAQLVQSDARAVRAGGTFVVDIPGYPPVSIPAEKGVLLPSTEPGSQTMRLRLDLPAMKDAPAPGSFARVLISASGSATASAGVLPLRVSVPREALVKHAELVGVYVIRDGQPKLRQVRLGGLVGSGIEILSGLQPGDVVALDPQAASRFRHP